MTTTVQDFFGNGACDLAGLANFLDSLSQAERLSQLGSFTRHRQSALWEAADGSERLTLEFFVPKGVSPGTPVVHHGVNVIPPVTTFQKVFARATDEASVGGLNVYALSPLVGDGFFALRETSGSEPDDHGVVVDYGLVPRDRCDGWPEVRPAKSQRLGRFFYSDNLDYMRRVSDHVSVGRMFPSGGSEFSRFTFVLCREET